jgi:hypothetical protein
MRIPVAVLLASGLISVSLSANGDGHTAVAGAARVPGLDAPDLRRAADGFAVARTLDPVDPREIVALGAIVLPVPRDAVVRSLKELMFTRSTAVPQLGRFSEAPVAADLQGLTIDASDLEDLRECTRARCKIHLPLDLVDALASSDDARRAHMDDDRIASVFKAFLAERARNYAAQGKTALTPYAQRPGVSGPAADIDSLLAKSAPYLDLAPAVSRHLQTFPQRTPGVDHAVYWTKEQFGWKPVIRLTHFAIGPIGASRTEPVIAASLQLYASHYVDASLGLVLVLDGGGPGQSCHVVFVNRSRVKAAAGRFGSITRRVIESRARDALRRFLETLKSRAMRAQPAS